MGRNERGRVAMVRIALRPRIAFSGHLPTPAEIHQMHEAAHDCCMIANSLATEIAVEEPVTQP
jgi:organic hydroperoxide reductase OsmC/OhrA